MKIVVIGYGWVGQANALALSLMGEEVYFYDKNKPDYHYKKHYGETYEKIGVLKNTLDVDAPDTCYIVCVGDRVLPTGEQDISYIRDALASLSNAKGTVILRSTVLPTHLSTLDFDFYVPEFLHEIKAVQECVKPHYFAVGSRGVEKHEPEFFKKWEASAYKVFRGTPEEASYIKYLSNIWNSARIAFVNEFGDAMHVPNSEENIQSIERVIDFVFGGKFYLRYGKAFGGHCLPKDTLAFYHSFLERGSNMSLISGIYESNNAHKALQEKYALIPEWFSEWEKPEISGKVALQSLVKSISRNAKKVFGNGKK